MGPVSLQHHPLTAFRGLGANGHLPRPLQQILFDTADTLAKPDALQFAGLASELVLLALPDSHSAGRGITKR